MKTLDPTREEMLALLADRFPCDIAETEFDREEAIYWFANDWHGGQWSKLYAVLCSSPYRPGPCTNGPEEPEMYQALEQEFVIT